MLRITKLRLEQTLKEAGIIDPATVTQLTVVGTITDDDLLYVRENMPEILTIHCMQAKTEYYSTKTKQS